MMRIYKIVIGGLEHTVQLSDEDAERYGKAAVEVKQTPAPANKARRAATKADESDDEPDSES